MYYGLGALLAKARPVKEIELVIIQPRASHVNGVVRRWRFAPVDLLEFSADLENFAKATEDPNAPLVSGSHCRFCPAAGICPEIASKALTIAQTEFSPTLSYDPHKLSETLNKLELLEGYAKSVRAFAYAEAEHGRTPPGWKLVPKRAIRRWKLDDHTVAGNLDKFPHIESMWEKSLLSPAKMEKLLGKNAKETIASLVEAVSSGMALVPDEDERQPIPIEFKPIVKEIESFFRYICLLRGPIG